MLHLIPAPVQRALMPTAAMVRSWWWRLAKPKLFGVCVMAFDDRDRLLLVRHSYGSRRWSLPAGGRSAREDAEAAVRREVREELAIELADLQSVALREEEIGRARHHVDLFTARAIGSPRPDMREVVCAGFFALEDLPAPLEKRVRPRLALLRG